MQQPIYISQSLNASPRSGVGVETPTEASLEEADIFAGLVDALKVVSEDAEIAEPQPVLADEEADPLAKLTADENSEEKELGKTTLIDEPLAVAVAVAGAEPEPKKNHLAPERSFPADNSTFKSSDVSDLEVSHTVLTQKNVLGNTQVLDASEVRDLIAPKMSKNHEQRQLKQSSETNQISANILIAKNPEILGQGSAEKAQSFFIDSTSVSLNQSPAADDFKVPAQSSAILPQNTQQAMAPSVSEMVFANPVESQTNQIPSNSLTAENAGILGQLSADKEQSFFALSTSVSVDQSSATRGLTMSPQPSVTSSHITQQVAAAIAQSSGGSIEITLNPEQLGRVRVLLTPSDNGTLVALQSERPDVLDALRRHIDLLAQDLGDAGFENLEFDFSGFDNSDGEEAAEGDGSDDEQSPIPLATTTYRINISDSGLDLRL
ncbi:flagellar hook-length control protein FliK [Thalassobium sp. R2A62]|uniref:flagellar hook-length control protein FliK n=1 Tax=Thalassobium sp. R2A62 TaxID=633131 RepID=UPI0001B1D380|nr:flagellar hook-length control protein FliK [Thalassobium sp. R2A62]EET48898.1 flagellar hook-length control protein, putative [Thalassobium sp. R2A62]